MSDITAWTSNGMDWSSADKIILGSMRDHCEAIRLAIRERQLALGQTPAGIFVENYEIRLMTIKYFCDSIQSAITTLITQFVNHTDNDGSWDGLAYDAFAPAWTEAALLTAIGAASRLVPNPLSLSAAWLFQQYQILNMLKWCKRNPTPTANGKFKVGSSSTNEDYAWNSYLSATWVDGYANHISMYSTYNGDYSYRSIRAAFTGVVLEVDADFDLYEPDIVISKIDNTGIAQSKLPEGVRLMSSGTQIARSAFDVLDEDLGDVDRLPIPPPSSPYQIASTGNGSRIVIYKPAFTFQEAA